MQTERRTNPYPWTWEPVAAITLLGGLVVVLAAQFGRTVANWTAGAGWVWPRTPLTGLAGLLAGDAAAGLDLPGPAAATPALYAWIAAVEAVTLAALIAAGLWAARRWGPGRLKGMASAAEAEHTLGVSRLRRVRAIIRPDLYPASRHTSWQPTNPLDGPGSRT